MNKYIRYLIFFFLPLSLCASEVYYCSDLALKGYAPDENYASKQYNPARFSIKVDFERNELVSEYLLFSGSANRQKCFKIRNALSCSNDLGGSFAIDPVTLKFHRSTIFLIPDQSDDIGIGHGTCEKF